MTFDRPEALLVLPLAWLWLRWRLWPSVRLGALRVAALLALAAALSGPTIDLAGGGRDVVLVVDRSQSMSAAALRAQREWFDELVAARRGDDRIGLVWFAAEARLAVAPTTQPAWPADATPADAGGSDLAAALALALAAIPIGRPASLVVASDGEVAVEAVQRVASAARRRGVCIDVLPAVREVGHDCAVVEVRAPAAVPIDAPFVLAATVLAPLPLRARYRLLHDGELLRRGEVELLAGANLLQLPGVVPVAGEHLFTVEIEAPGDPVAANDRGSHVVRGEAPLSVLCVTPGGREDRLTRTLRAAGFAVEVCSPGAAPLALGHLAAHSTVVLEDVPASALPPGAANAVLRWVRELGGSLLMTGGAHSFGVGGYRQTPIETALPVTLEVREEQRRQGLALAIALDRSGSMQAEVGETTKMQLANLGAVTAIEQLSRLDSVALLAVDTAAHVVARLQSVEDELPLLQAARSIESAGGGIYVEEALHAAAAQLEGASQERRHILLFADASDAERGGDYREFVPQLAAGGCTVSVIGLGSTSDADAALLIDVAKLGGGRCEFVADAADLPRAFAQEAIRVVRSSMIDEPTAVRVLPSLSLLGDLPPAAPAVGGYSVVWARDEAEVGMVADDEFGAPLLTWWQCGLGRTAAFCGEVDGDHAGAWAEWSGAGDVLATLVRWLGGEQLPGLFVEARCERDVGVYELELADAAADGLDAAHGTVTAPDGSSTPLALERDATGRVVARVPMPRDGVYRAALQVGASAVRLPPLCRSHPAELTGSLDPRAGERRLRDLARATDGRVAPSVAEVLRGDRATARPWDPSFWLVLAGTLLLFTEIAVRRLRWFGRRLPTPVPAARPIVAGSRAASRPDPSAASAVDPAGGLRDEGPAAGDTRRVDAVSGGADDGLLTALERARRRGQRRV